MRGFFVVLFLAWVIVETATAQITIRIQVLDAASKSPLPRASLKLSTVREWLRCDENGRLNIAVSKLTDTVTVSFLGYQTEHISASSLEKNGTVLMKVLQAELKQVEVVTGYQRLSSEKVTGSFTKLDGELINRRVSPDILARLADVTPGLIFNRGILSGQNDISIRGRSTIFSNAQPLIVLDNFPYEGDISNINPNDVESVTVLKDGAAASIWGSMAGNGVIVITTKSGKRGQKAKLDFNANLTFAGKPDLFYNPRMTTADYLEVERMLFSRGFYQTREQSLQNVPLTPAVELLIANRDGRLSTSDLNEQFATLSGQDIREQQGRYLYRNSLQQQYSLSVTGGGQRNSYRFSIGQDFLRSNMVGDQNGRTTVGLLNSVEFIPAKLELRSDILLSSSSYGQNSIAPTELNMAPGYPLYYYARLSDESGTPLSLVHDYRTSFISSAVANGLLDWSYVPLLEQQQKDNEKKVLDYRINSTLRYQVLKGLSASIFYQFAQGRQTERNHYSQDSYFARDLINTFRQTNGSNPVPLGGILDRSVNGYSSHALRGQIDYVQLWKERHEINAIAGLEVRDRTTTINSDRDYGYDDLYVTSRAVDYVNFYRYSYSGAGTQGTIPFRNTSNIVTDRNLSAYLNASYIYHGRYIVTASMRRDESNIFGVNTNEKGVPLWSVGLAWNLHREEFLKDLGFSQLKIRTSYGIGGNVNKSISALPTVFYNNGANSATRLPYAQMRNAPNPELRWEKIKTFNLGLDFAVRSGALSGSVDLFSKKGIDLIGTTPYAPSSGITSFTGNTATTLTNGVDMVLNTTNLKGRLAWNSSLLFSYARDKVLSYNNRATAASSLSFGSGLQVVPVEGRPLFAMFSYAWAGLDPQTGEPLGILEGETSKNYSGIVTSANTDNLVFHGSARPTTFGALRNTLSWRGVSFSFNISYRLGYYFRRQSVNYINVLSGFGSHGDYGARWKNPGDENHTQVPSLPQTINNNRESFYQYSSSLIERADHIRLQDMTLDYDLKRLGGAIGKFHTSKLYLYANNLGILWKSSKLAIDPDFQMFRPIKSISLGFKLGF